MRDFRDAKTMAQTLRDSLTTTGVSISHSESLELVSKMLGVADWNTLSAMLKTRPPETGRPAIEQPASAARYPAIPIRDLVPFPPMIFPLFVGREKTMRALDHAFEAQREVVLAVQRESGVDEPGFDDIYEIGVLARLLQVERLTDNTMKVLTQAYRRVVIHRFLGETGAFHAEVSDISEGPIPDAPELIQKAVERFMSYTSAREISVRQIWPPLDQSRDPGRVADVISQHMALPIPDRQGLLATLDPVLRLEKVCAAMAHGDAPGAVEDAT